MPRSIAINELSIPTTGLNDIITSAGFNPVFTSAAKVTVFINGDAVGLTQTLKIDDGTASEELIPSGSGISAASTTGKIKTNEDYVGVFAVRPGKLLWNLVNTTAGAIKANALLQIE